MVTTIMENPGSPSMNDDFSLSRIKIEPLPEYATIGPALTHARRQDAEVGPAHLIARRLGELFCCVVPHTPLLNATYGKRASQIINTPGANPVGSTQLHGPFADHFIGADATSVWAAATSGDPSIAVHFLACLIARAIEDPVVATDLWAEFIAHRESELLDNAPANTPGYHDWAIRIAASRSITRDDLSQLDASTRRWLRTADEVMAHEHSQFHLAYLPFYRDVFDTKGTTLYTNVKEAWITALNMMESLLGGKSLPESAIGPAGFIAMSAWHLYPPLTMADCAEMTVNTIQTTDELMKTAEAHSITFLNPPYEGKERNVSWPLTLADFGPQHETTPVTLIGTVTERFSITDLHLVAFGSLLRLWGVHQQDDPDPVARWMVALWECVDRAEQRQARPEWLRLLASAASQLLTSSDTERDYCQRLIRLGHRQGHRFLGVPSGKAALPWFGLRSPHILSSLSQESPAECAIQYLRELCSHGELGPDDALITWICPSSKGSLTHLYTSAVPREHVEYRMATAAGSEVPDKLPDLQADLPLDKGKNKCADKEKMEEVVSLRHSRWLGQSGADGTRLLELKAKKRPDNSYESSMRRKIDNFTVNVNRGYSDLEASERSNRRDHDYFASHDRPSFDTPGFATSAKSKEEDSYSLKSLIQISGLFTGEYKAERGSGILTSASGFIPDGLASRGHHSGPLAYDKMLNTSQDFFRLWLGLLPSEEISQFEETVSSLRRGDPASLLSLEESTARLNSGVNPYLRLNLGANPELLVQFFNGSDPYDPSDFAKPVLELMETERRAINELLRPLRNLAFATGIYTDLDGATISSRVITTGLANPAWGDAEILHTRAQVFGCIAMMESGVVDLKLEDMEHVLGISSGNSLFVLSRLLSDPGQQHEVSKTAVTRLIGNVGRPGITLLTTVPPDRPLSWSDKAPMHRPFDSKCLESFAATTLQLFPTKRVTPLLSGTHNDQRHQASLLECVLSVQDGTGWLATVDVLASFDNGQIPTLPRPVTKCGGLCEQTKPELAKEMQKRATVADSWMELMELMDSMEDSAGLVFVRTGGYSAARLAIAAYLAAQCSGKEAKGEKRFAVLEPEGTECTVCIYRRLKQYVKRHDAQASRFYLIV